MRSDSEYVGGIPVVVSLAADDVLHPTERPAPAAFVLPRTTMLIAVVSDLLYFFRPYAAALHPESTQVWFSVGDSPISWLYPAGVIKDYVKEYTRAERLAQFQATVAPPGSAAGSSSSACSSPLVQSLPFSVASEPLDLTFHIHSITKGSARAGTVPLYVNYDRLEEHIRMEIKQSHKAAYTCLYGNYTHYQREAESTLLPAIGLALYRPFDEAAQQQLQQQRMLAQGGQGGGGSAGSPRGRYQGSATDFSSPFLLLQYQQLLQGVLAPRPHVAYLLRVGFPYAYRGATSRYEGGHLRYDGHRVSAAPAVADGDALVDTEQLPLGLLLWRLFRLPVLRWRAQQGEDAAGSTDVASLTEVQRSYHDLLRSLAPYYADAPAAATEKLAEQSPLMTGTPADPPAWATWERDMSGALMRDYEAGSGSTRVGLPFLDDANRAAAASPSSPSSALRRMRFEVQGIQPSLATPGSFLEAHLSSSDRAIFVTVLVQ